MLFVGAETENVFQNVVSENSERTQVSSHLGHSEKIRDNYYLIRNRSTVVQAAFRLHSLFETAGEAEDNSGTPGGNEPSGGEVEAEEDAGEEHLGSAPPSPDFSSTKPPIEEKSDEDGEEHLGSDPPSQTAENSDYDFEVSHLKVNQSCHISL